MSAGPGIRRARAGKSDPNVENVSKCSNSRRDGRGLVDATRSYDQLSQSFEGILNLVRNFDLWVQAFAAKVCDFAGRLNAIKPEVLQHSPLSGD